MVPFPCIGCDASIIPPTFLLARQDARSRKIQAREQEKVDANTDPKRSSTASVIVKQMKATMIGVLFAATSSAASAFAPKSKLAFRYGATRAFSRSTVMMANPKGTNW